MRARNSGHFVLSSSGPAALVLREVRRDDGEWARARRRLSKDGAVIVASVGLLAIAVLAISAPLISALITGYPPDKIDLDASYAIPSARHWLGTDEYGRDNLTRAAWAGQVSLTVGLGVAVVVLIIGVPIGLIAGYYSGLADKVITSIIDTWLSLPNIFALVLLVTIVPMNKLSLAVVIGGLGWMGAARQVRGKVILLRKAGFIEAARAIGADERQIFFRHILPSLSPIVLVVAGFEVANGILAESALSFLGLGTRPPDASWGNMLANAISYVNKAPLLVVLPGLLIFVTVLCIFVVTDAARDALDPRTHSVRKSTIV